LPVKIISKDGVANLYDILCALKYAKNRGANIINASFGYYSPKIGTGKIKEDTASILFKNFLIDYFDTSKILMVAAAGNQDDINENPIYNPSNSADKRDLDKVNFYPASFAEVIPNIIAVTTVRRSPASVSPHQNFSRHIVDIGVNADIIDSDHYYFFNPRVTPPQYTVEGSSFATPIATGKIAANYYLLSGILSTSPINKNAILTKLGTNHLLDNGVSPFTGKIKGGNIMDK
jgi:hypothetical protein